MHRQNRLPSDTYLNILAFVALSAGVVLTTYHPDIQFNLHQLMFGSLLFASLEDIILIGLVSIAIAMFLMGYWHQLVLSILHPALAQAEGIAVTQLHFAMTFITALMIAVSVKAFGILLMTSLLIIPAAIAQQFAKNTIQMAILSSLIGLSGSLLGLALSIQLDLPVSPTIICCLGLALFTLLGRNLFKIS